MSNFLIKQKLLISGEKRLMSAERKGCVTWFIYYCDKFHNCTIYVTDFREGAFLPPHPWADLKRPILIGLMLVHQIFQQKNIKNTCQNQKQPPPEVFYKKKVFLNILQNSQENTCARAPLLIKLLAQACNFTKKETLTQTFFCKFCQILKNSFFIEKL